MNGEQKKFLDENGLKILWNQISMHDYPNNAALTSVINAIDANKADKTDIPRIDTTLSAAGAAADAKAVGQAIENIELTPGPKGDSGVYVGISAPTDESVNVWVNPNGEAADFPTEGKWELIASGTMEEDANGIKVTLDNAGNPFELTKAALYVKTIKPGAEMTSTVSCHISVGSWWWAGVTGVSQSSHKAAAVAYANMDGPAFAAVNPGTGNTRYGNALYLFGDDHVGQTITRADFNAANAQHRLGAGLTYELWGVRK